jgi:malate synthase
MTSPFLRAYSQLLIKTCHRRNVHAMGGMAAQIPIRNDAAANDAAMEKVRADKLREAGDGHDGTWVAHPGLVALAKDVFDKTMPGPNQIARKRQDVHVTAADLLKVPSGTITEAGLRSNINVGLGYLESWLRGSGCVPLDNLMEDAATAEISRSQVWQWIRHGAKLADATAVTRALAHKILAEELAKLGKSAPQGNRYDDAAALFARVIDAERFVEFLTLPAYEQLVREGA